LTGEYYLKKEMRDVERERERERERSWKFEISN